MKAKVREAVWLHLFLNLAVGTDKPKHVEFHSKNKFEKLIHLVGFIIRIYHDARSPERQIHNDGIKIHGILNNFSLYFCTKFSVKNKRSFNVGS